MSNKRRRIKIRKFIERIILPLMISTLLLLIGFIIAVTFFDVRFASLSKMIIILIIAIFLIGEVVFAISHEIIQKIMKR